ncbi:putative acetyltransferase C complex catalytic subunit Mak3, partial [Operophtera brumata]
MNQVADENYQSIQCSQIGTNMKNKSKKAKDRSEGKDEKSLLNQDDLSETLANALHINTISNHLTNGTSDHSPSGSPGGKKVSQGGNSDLSTHVNSVQCSNVTSEQIKEKAAQQAIDCIIDSALENLENTLSKQVQAQDEIEIVSYESELQMPEIMRLIQKDLSEPYSIYTYRYFIHNWPKLCFLAKHEGKCIGAIVCKLDMHRNVVKRGYIAMLAVDEKYRSRKIGSQLAQKAIK